MVIIKKKAKSGYQVFGMEKENSRYPWFLCSGFTTLDTFKFPLGGTPEPQFMVYGIHEEM